MWFVVLFAALDIAVFYRVITRFLTIFSETTVIGPFDGIITMNTKGYNWNLPLVLKPLTDNQSLWRVCCCTI